MNQVSTAQDIPEDATVNELIRIFPGAVSVFNDFGIDACCGGATPVRAAAQRDGADPQAVLEALVRVIQEES